MITVSRKSILRQIVSNLGAVIRTEGIVKLDQSRRIAWLTIEIPAQDRNEGVTTESFHGTPCASDYDAEENVSGVAIAHFISQKNIHVNDVNFVAFHQTYNKLRHYISWCHILNTRLQLLSMEKNQLLNAHVNLLKRLGLICATNGDILPLRPSTPTMHPPASHVGRVMYIGPDPPETRYEELGRELFNVLQEYSPVDSPIIN